MSELAAAYEALCTGHAGPDLPPLPIQYADFAAWQRARLDGGVLDAQVCPDRGISIPFHCMMVVLFLGTGDREAMCVLDTRIAPAARCHGAVADAG